MKEGGVALLSCCCWFLVAGCLLIVATISRTGSGEKLLAGFRQRPQLIWASIVCGLTKSLPEMIDSQINSGIKAGLKQFGWNSGSGDVPRKIANKNTSQVTKAKVAPSVRTPQPVSAPDMDPASRIGVEGESLMKAAGPVNDHDAFVDGVDQLAGMTGVDDLRGAFRLINQMREDSGDSLSHNLFYYK